MRVWIGEEREGTDKGELTLFVEGKIINCDLINYHIKDITVDRVYFGAGRVDPLKIFNVSKLKELHPNITLILEANLSWYTKAKNDVMARQFDERIVRIYNSQFTPIAEFDKIKIDNGTDVWVKPLDEMINTSLYDLNNGLFSGDKLLYEDGGK